MSIQQTDSKQNFSYNLQFQRNIITISFNLSSTSSSTENFRAESEE